MQKKPQDWTIDSTQDRFYGVTHKPTGFRFHMPKTVVPDAVTRPSPAPAANIPVPNPVSSAETLAKAAEAAQSFYLGAAQGHLNNVLAGRVSPYVPGEGILGSVSRHLGSVRQRGDRSISETMAWDRLQNAMDPNRAIRQTQAYLAGQQRPLVSHPLDRVFQGEPVENVLIPRLPR
jgi:hypothetical protein